MPLNKWILLTGKRDLLYYKPSTYKREISQWLFVNINDDSYWPAFIFIRLLYSSTYYNTISLYNLHTISIESLYILLTNLAGPPSNFRGLCVYCVCNVFFFFWMSTKNFKQLPPLYYGKKLLCKGKCIRGASIDDYV